MLKKSLPYLIAPLIAFYGLPFLMRDTGSAMLFLLVVIPLICFISSLILGNKLGFYLPYPLMVGLLFIPTLFIYYNESAWVYSPAYAALSLTGVVLGSGFLTDISERK